MLRADRPRHGGPATTSAGSGSPTRSSSAARGLAGARGARRSTRPRPRTARGRRARRHLFTSGRAVTGVEDEVLDLDGLGASAAGALGRRGRAAGRAQGRGAPAGWATSSRRSRPSRTASSAPTCRGVLVVQGGPGTGKTAVALHRAAYLLYTHRAAARALRRAARRAEPGVPALHRAGAAVARRDRRGD